MKRTVTFLRLTTGYLGTTTQQRGSIIVIVAIILPLLFAFGVLAFDVTRLWSSRKELQNAADACALAAARKLYNDEGTAILATANDHGFKAAGGNPSENEHVEVWHGGAEYPPGTEWPTDPESSNQGDIKRGHWSFDRSNNYANPTFTPNPSLHLTELWNASSNELDADTDFINAVRCVTRRQATPVTNFLAPMLSLFGGNFLTSIVRAEAVAIRGFAGKFVPWEMDAPIAICKESIIDNDGKLTCTYGRMMPGNDDTAMWTNFTQDEAPYDGESSCGEPANASNSPYDPDDPDSNPGLRWLIRHDGVCQYDGINPDQVRAGFGISTVGGELATVHATLRGCWQGAPVDHDNDSTTANVSIDPDNDGKPDYPWKITLPVIDCLNPGCNKIVGAVSVEVLWITVNGSDPNYDDIPVRMWDEQSNPPAFWTCDSTSSDPTTRKLERIACVNSFFQRFNLHDADGSPAHENSSIQTDRDWLATSLYFRPGCEVQEPVGHTGGENYGVLSQYPALVR